MVSVGSRPHTGINAARSVAANDATIAAANALDMTDVEDALNAARMGDNPMVSGRQGISATDMMAGHALATQLMFDPGDPGRSADDIGDQADDRGNGKKKEELGTPAVTLTAPTGSLQAGQWFNPLARQEYTAPAAQDWSRWMFGSPFGEQGGLLYQPWSAEYGQQYVPSNIWNWNPMEMSKATAFAPPIASTSILGDSASVANTTANNNNNNTVVTTDPTEGMGGGTGPMAGDVPTHPLFSSGLTPAEIAWAMADARARGDDATDSDPDVQPGPPHTGLG